MHNYDYLVVSPGSAAYREYLALRHEVFCAELKRLPPSERRCSGVLLESDEFDAHSVHVLCRSRETGAAVGCSRLILPGPKGLNVSTRYTLLDGPKPHAGRVAEIGRLAVANQLRCYRKGFAAVPVEGSGGRGSNRSAADPIKPYGSAVALGLYREIFWLARIHDITHCYAAMEPALARLLNRLGFPFRGAGPLNTDVYPPRQAYLIGVQAVSAALAIRSPALHQFIFGDNGIPRLTSAGTWPALPDPLDLQPGATELSA